ncbi:MAG: ABC transporter substrate-binding protein [Chloroflexia bacterium]
MTAYRVAVLLVLGTLLVACGAPSPPATVPPATATATVPPKTATPLPLPTPVVSPTPTVAEAIIIGLLQEREPDTLWPLGSLTDEQRLILEAVMEPPMTTLDFDLQPVLFEQVPTLENGGARFITVQVPIDPATGAITVTNTGVYTQARQLQVTFRLRPNLFWSDGRPLQAQDSVFGYSVACSPEAGNAAYARCEKVERYEALDARTLRVTFKPNVMELDYSTYYWPFFPEHAWSRYTVEEMTRAEEVARRLSPSYGPYVVQEWVPGTSITLVRNPYYALHGQDSPRVNKLIFKFAPDAYSLLSQLLAGQVDLVERRGLQGLEPRLLQALEENGLLRLYTQPALLWENIVMNLNDPANLSQPHPVLGDLRVRQALAYATNRQEMAKAVYPFPVPVLNSWILPGHWAYPGDEALTLYPYDPVKASALLEEAGWILADDGYRYKDGQRLHLRIYILAGQPLRETIVQQFQGALEPLGMEIEVVRVKEEDWYGPNSPLLRRQFDLAEFAWVVGLEPDGQVVYTCGEIPSEANGWRGQNYAGWCNETATQALLSAATELDRGKRARLYRLAQEQFTAELPAIPLFTRLEYDAATPRLHNLKPNPTESLTWNCWEWLLLSQR